MNTIKKHPGYLEMLDRFRGRGYGSILSYDELNTAAHGDIRGKLYGQFCKFSRELLHQENKKLECIRGEGYRIILPNEHTRVANRELKRATRRAITGVDIILHVDYEALNERERAQATLVATRLQNIAQTLIGENKSIKGISTQFRLPSLPR